MEIRKMKIWDLEIVNQSFSMGKNIGITSLQSDYLYVAEDQNKIKGFLFADTMKTTGIAILVAIEVLEECRKKGIAKQLMDRFEKDAMENEINSIMVFYNKKAGVEKFYKKFNYLLGQHLKTACKILER